MRAIVRGLFVLVVFLSFVAPVVAQEEYLELLRSDLNTRKVAVITAVMDFTPEQGEVFWPIYREYEVEQAQLGDQSVELLKSYAEKFDTLDEASAKDLTGRWFDLQQRTLDLRKKYFKKVEKALGAVVASRFTQIENQIGLALQINVLSQLPLLQKGMQEAATTPRE